ncbi:MULTISPECIES: LysM peptidoglycan-binding domain-containing protein [Marinobacter]|jgi:peptidoglycan lytic transglycosylase D|uniref:lytic transglycosylase n=1 Tax=Marinobacter TaxID=2742 RepID=UPI000C94012B|nr:MULTISPECIES: LysM peptidoglycan-binding domain-containing protein [unclassified Marinobacter]MAB53658.1 lytic transglycosylase [Marinobacter sp.]|tara:strand:- start:32824 stop:34548 length:1725 start_codon:yes stop_codon:yes gene_type:complete
MTVSRFSTLFLLGALASGCSALDPFSESPSSDVLASEKLTVAAGDDELKEAIESSPGDESTGRASRTKLDDAIDPTLKKTAEDAREKLDDPDQKIAEENDATPDLWHRLRAGFALDHDASEPRVQAQLNWYKKHPRYIDRVVDRGSRYLHYIVSEAEKRGLPTELALLPVVESAFDPFAYSHGRAAGLWQFIPSTGKYFGLTQSWWHDDRRDIIAATDAALTYLDRLATRFDGDYMLALAAYNSGGGTVSSAMRRNRKRNQPTDYWSLDLPRETRHYVPKLIALAKIFDDPQAYGIELPPLDDEPYFEIVDTGSQLDLAQAAELAGVDIDEIYLLNPSYNRWATSPDGPHRLLVPRDHAETFATALKGMDPAKRVSWRNYKVESGDTLSTIAKRYSTTPSVIQQVNNLDSHIIRIGQRLMIPSAAEQAGTYSLSASERLARKQERSGKNANGTRVDYKVRSGDTFWDIAREHRVSVRQLASWNGMAPGDPLMPGKKLVIWSKSKQPAMLASTNRGKGMVRKVGYQVRKGDSLSTIASRFAVNVRDIASWNDLNTSRYLQPGQSLVLYVDIRNSP